MLGITNPRPESDIRRPLRGTNALFLMAKRMLSYLYLDIVVSQWMRGFHLHGFLLRRIGGGLHTMIIGHFLGGFSVHVEASGSRP